jgi:hypothetical protein
MRGRSGLCRRSPHRAWGIADRSIAHRSSRSGPLVSSMVRSSRPWYGALRGRSARGAALACPEADSCARSARPSTQRRVRCDGATPAASCVTRCATRDDGGGRGDGARAAPCRAGQSSMG